MVVLTTELAADRIVVVSAVADPGFTNGVICLVRVSGRAGVRVRGRPRANATLLV